MYKKSGWAMVVFIATLFEAALLVLSIVALVLSLGPVEQAARQAAQQSTTDQAAIEFAVNTAIAVVITAFVFGSALSVLQIIGGFLFSIKGRWGIFCIIMAILNLVSGVFSLVSDINNRAAVLSLVTSILGLLIAIVLVIACFKLKAIVDKR
ncbi:MAG: hypothetical protein II467_07195 [Bacilli bacterium]|nr:hypothetical protein [Bacilli bacterium]MBQ4255793.1 hypothetical protein [Bacilli bacterium]